MHNQLLVFIAWSILALFVAWSVARALIIHFFLDTYLWVLAGKQAKKVAPLSGQPASGLYCPDSGSRTHSLVSAVSTAGVKIIASIGQDYAQKRLFPAPIMTSKIPSRHFCNPRL